MSGSLATVTRLPVLVVQHEDQCPPGWMGDWLTDAGVVLDVRRPYRGDVLPTTLEGHAAMLVLGGSMDAWSDDAHPWLSQVQELVRRAADDGTPVLGICLGHQLAAIALGGTVARNPRGQQIGVLPMGWTEAAATDALLGPLRRAAVGVQWNNDVVTVVPAGTEVLARTPDGELQAARFAPSVWGVQCHPEAGEVIVSAWAANDRDEAASRGVDVDEYVARVAAAEPELQTTWRPLAQAFAALGRDVVETP